VFNDVACLYWLLFGIFYDVDLYMIFNYILELQGKC
jgi:hypothetical protein